MKRTRRSWPAILSILLLAAPMLMAQGTQGSISGSVRDESGGVIPGVTVTVTHLDTGTSRTLVSNDEGLYRAPALDPGSYQVRGELTGFQTSIRTGIQLSVGRDAVVNLTMRVGEISEQVTVTGEAPLVDTKSTTMGGLVDTQQIEDLPLNGRNMISLTLLEGAVANNRGQTAGNTSIVRGFGMAITVAGARPYMNSYLLDGTHANDHSGYVPGSIAGVQLGVDSIREFKMQTANFAAEYGSAAGGIITAVTKSGTNEFHGNIFEFHRNDNLDATQFLSNSRGVEKEPFIRNQFGASIGGPIVRDQTFFFFNYEGLRDRLGRTVIANVLSPATKQGILPFGGTPNSRFRNACHPAFPLNPATGNCEGTIDPRVVPYLSLWPTPNGQDNGDGTAELLVDASEPTDENFYTAKVDHTLSDMHSLAFRFNIDDANKTSGSNGVQQALLKSRQQNYAVELKSVISPTLLNVARYGFIRRTVSETNDDLIDIDPDLYFLPFTGSMGAMWIISTGGVGTPLITPTTDARPRLITQNLFQATDSVSYTTGNHSLKFGADIKRWQVNTQSVSRWGGRYRFTTLEDFLTANAREVSFTPADGSDFIRGHRQTDIGLFIQDDWQFRPNLTVNLGVRWEAQTVPTEVNGKVANLQDPWRDSTYALGDPWFDNPGFTNFAPRIGLAWDPFGDGKTSIRTGFGMFYSLMNVFGSYQQPSTSMPPAVRITIRGSQVNFPDPTAGGTITSDFARENGQLAAFTIFDVKTPYMEKWNLDLQRELMPGLMASVGYIGSHGVKQWMDSDFQMCIPENIGQAGLPYFRRSCNGVRNPNFTAINVFRNTGSSYYHAMVAKVNRRFANGVAFQASYTWSKSTDSDSGYRTPDGPGNTTLNWKGTIDNPGLYKALSGFDVRRNLSINGSWALPGPADGAARWLLGGWQINGILSLADGQPFTAKGNAGLTSQYDKSPATTNVPADFVGTNNNPVNEPFDVNNYFDKSQFAVTQPTTDLPGCSAADPCIRYGTAGRNTIIGPGLSTFDLSLFKQFPLNALGEQSRVEFRAEFFNIFNRANFDQPASTISAGSSGRITTETTTARQVQFGLKITF